MRYLKPLLLCEIIASLLLVLFVYTATSKILEHEKFVRVLGKSPLLSNVSFVVAAAVPLAEIFTSVLLMIPKWREKGFIASFVLLFCFSFYIGYMLIFSPQLPCSCGGVLKQLGWAEHLVFNLFFMLLSYVGVRLTGNSYQPNYFNSFLRKKQGTLKTCRRE